MDLLLQIISNEIKDEQTAETVIVLLVMVAVFIVVIAVGLLIASYYDPVRIRFLSKKDASLSPIELQGGTAKKLLEHRQMFMPSDQELLSRTMIRLHHAGFHKRSSVLSYFGIRMLLTIFLPVLTLLLSSIIPGFSATSIMLGVLCALMLGYIGPSFVLDYLIAKRKKSIQRAFPDALDLLVVCSEAGLSLNAAFQKVSVEINLSHPELGEEMETVLSEIQAGVDRNKALKGLADRTGVESIKGLMATLSQCMRFGTDVAEALRVYSEDLRDQRKQDAEQQAAKISVKIVFPLAVCLLPCFIMIILVPVWMSLMKGLGTIAI